MKVWIDKHWALSKGQTIGLVFGLLFLIGLGICLISPVQSTLISLGW